MNEASMYATEVKVPITCTVTSSPCATITGACCACTTCADNTAAMQNIAHGDALESDMIVYNTFALSDGVSFFYM